MLIKALSFFESINVNLKEKYNLKIQLKFSIENIYNCLIEKLIPFKTFSFKIAKGTFNMKERMILIRIVKVDFFITIFA